MGTLTTSLVIPSELKPFSLPPQHQNSLFIYRRRLPKKNQSIVPVARLFGPAIFEASKLKVLFLGVDEKKHPGKLPRTYTLTHSDITSKLTLAISQTINNSQDAIKVSLLNVGVPKQEIAEGLLLSMDPLAEIDGEPLGPDFCKMYVENTINPNTLLEWPRQGIRTIGESVCHHVAWRSSDVLQKD